MLQSIQNTADSFPANWSHTDVCEIVTDMIQYDHGMTHIYLEHHVVRFWKFHIWIFIANAFDYIHLKKVNEYDGNSGLQ